MTIEVTWSASFHEDAEEPFAKDWCTLCPTWAEFASNGAGVASYIMEDFFDDVTWGRHFEPDDTHNTVYLDIHKPASIAGRYRIELERRTEATAHRIGAVTDKAAGLPTADQVRGILREAE